MEFEEFWSLYPNKQGKKGVERQYAKLTAAEKERIGETLPERVRRDVKWKKGVYIPMPSTYLNQGRWDDEYERAPLFSSTTKPLEPTDHLCLKCRSDERSQRHNDICIDMLAYFDYKFLDPQTGKTFHVKL